MSAKNTTIPCFFCCCFFVTIYCEIVVTLEIGYQNLPRCLSEHPIYLHVPFLSSSIMFILPFCASFFVPAIPWIPNHNSGLLILMAMIKTVTMTTTKTTKKTRKTSIFFFFFLIVAFRFVNALLFSFFIGYISLTLLEIECYPVWSIFLTNFGRDTWVLVFFCQKEFKKARPSN